MPYRRLRAPTDHVHVLSHHMTLGRGAPLLNTCTQVTNFYPSLFSDYSQTWLESSQEASPTIFGAHSSPSRSHWRLAEYTSNQPHTKRIDTILRWLEKCIEAPTSSRSVKEEEREIEKTLEVELEQQSAGLGKIAGILRPF